MPDYSSDLFVFLQTTSVTPHRMVHFLGTWKPPMTKSGQDQFSANGPLFIFYFFKVTCITGRDYRVPLSIFGTVRHFFENFLLSPKGPRVSFLLFCNRMFAHKSKRVLFFPISSIRDIFRMKKIQRNVLPFLNLRYSADFRGSCLAPIG